MWLYFFHFLFFFNNLFIQLNSLIWIQCKRSLVQDSRIHEAEFMHGITSVEQVMSVMGSGIRYRMILVIDIFRKKTIKS